MKIEKFDVVKNREHILKEVNNDAIIDDIVSVCQADDVFNINDKMKSIDEKLNLMHTAIERQDSLLSQSNELKKNMNKKLATLENENFSMKEKLLEKWSYQR